MSLNLKDIGGMRIALIGFRRPWSACHWSVRRHAAGGIGVMTAYIVPALVVLFSSC